MSKIVVADTDALIALTFEEDPHHKKAISTLDMLTQEGFIIIFPVTVFPEAMTTLKRSLNQPKKAHLLNKKLQQGEFNIEYVDADILKLATEYFDQAISKKNTFFDAIVAATAQKLEAESVFSFDNWYPHLGFKLTGE